MENGLRIFPRSVSGISVQLNIEMTSDEQPNRHKCDQNAHGDYKRISPMANPKIKLHFIRLIRNLWPVQGGRSATYSLAHLWPEAASEHKQLALFNGDVVFSKKNPKQRIRNR